MVRWVARRATRDPSDIPRLNSMPHPTSDDFLRIGPRVRVLPIIHGSGDFAIRVREELLSRPYDCVAVPLPPVVPGGGRGGDRPAAGHLGRRPARRRHRRRRVVRRRRLGLQLRPHRPLPGGDRRSPAGDGGADEPGVHRHGDPPVRGQHGDLSRRLRPQEGPPRGLRRRRPAGPARPRAGPALEADRLDGRPAPRARRPTPIDPPGLLAGRLALDPGRLPETGRGRGAGLVLRAFADLRRRPQDPRLPARRACRS